MPESQSRLIFLHVPKTGGISLYMSVQEALGPEQCIRFGTGTSPSEFQSKPLEFFQRYRFVSGHFGLQRIDSKGLDWPIVSLVRDPVDRSLSQLDYICEYEDHPWHAEYRSFSVDQYIEHLMTTSQSNIQCSYFGGKSAEEAIGIIQRRRLLLAPVEAHHQLQGIVGSYLGVNLQPRRENMTSTRRSRSSLSNQQLARLEKLTHQDAKLYAWARSSFAATRRLVA